MNYNKTKHEVLKLFVDVRLKYIEEYHDVRDFYLTIDEIVKKQKLSYETVKLILASLLANEEVRFNNSVDEDGFTGYAITNKGVFAYEDEKYIRIKTERSRATWSYIISVASFIISLIAIFIAIRESRTLTKDPVKTDKQIQKKTIPSKEKIIDSPKIKKQSEMPKKTENATTANSGFAQ